MSVGEVDTTQELHSKLNPLAGKVNEPFHFTVVNGKLSTRDRERINCIVAIIIFLFQKIWRQLERENLQKEFQATADLANSADLAQIPIDEIQILQQMLLAADKMTHSKIQPLEPLDHGLQQQLLLECAIEEVENTVSRSDLRKGIGLPGCESLNFLKLDYTSSDLEKEFGLTIDSDYIELLDSEKIPHHFSSVTHALGTLADNDLLLVVLQSKFQNPVFRKLLLATQDWKIQDAFEFSAAEDTFETVFLRKANEMMMDLRYELQQQLLLKQTTIEVENTVSRSDLRKGIGLPGCECLNFLKLDYTSSDLEKQFGLTNAPEYIELLEDEERTYHFSSVTDALNAFANNDLLFVVLQSKFQNPVFRKLLLATQDWKIQDALEYTEEEDTDNRQFLRIANEIMMALRIELNFRNMPTSLVGGVNNPVLDFLRIDNTLFQQSITVTFGDTERAFETISDAIEAIQVNPEVDVKVWVKEFIEQKFRHPSLANLLLLTGDWEIQNDPNVPETQFWEHQAIANKFLMDLRDE